MIVGRNSPCPCGSGKKSKHCCRAETAVEVPSGRLGVATPEAQRLNGLKRAARELFTAGSFLEASVPLGDIVHLRPESADAHYDLGVAYIRCGHFVEAAASLRRAVKIRPSFQAALEQLAHALEHQMINAEARIIYLKLSRSAVGPHQKLYYVAKAQALRGRLQDAEVTLRRLLNISPSNDRIRHFLGDVLMDQGKFEEAALELRVALETRPSAFHKLATAQPMTEAERPLLKRMRAKTEEVGLDAEDRTLILYGLGKAYDDLGDYEEAIHCYDAANGLRRKGARFDRVALARRYDDIIARYDVASLDRLSHINSERVSTDGELPILIVGLPRSGTTLVEQILSSHQAVAAAGELQYWRVRALEMECENSAWRDAPALRQAADDYLELLRKIDPAASRVTDKAPLNFETIGLIMSALPKCRIIHCRRHPIDTCLSIYFTEFSSSLGFAFDRGDIVYVYRQYLRLMEHWRHVLPSDRFLEVDYESLVTNPETTVRRMIALAGLTWDDRCLAPEQNQRVVKTASLWQARQPIYTTSVERWRHYEPWLGELSEFASEMSFQ